MAKKKDNVVKMPAAKAPKKKAPIGEKNYQPLTDWVVLKLVDPNVKSKIIGAEVAEQDKQKVVISVGPDVKNVKVGQKVELPNQAMVQILPQLDGEGEYATLHERDIIGVYK